MTDPLLRFVQAQEDGGCYHRAVRELRRGRKESHWMWFVFPQVEGLGRSAQARRFAISGLDEARDYLAHPVLGRRLRDCARILLDLAEPDPVTVLGPVDAMKLRSSMTLFAQAAADEEVFRDVLERYFGGEPDAATLDRLRPAAGGPAGDTR